MKIEEHINLQKGKEIPNRLKTASNSENEAIDNYIQSRIRIRENLQEQRNNDQVPKELIEDMKKQIITEIQKSLEE